MEVGVAPAGTLGIDIELFMSSVNDFKRGVSAEVAASTINLVMAEVSCTKPAGPLGLAITTRNPAIIGEERKRSHSSALKSAFVLIGHSDPRRRLRPRGHWN